MKSKFIYAINDSQIHYRFLIIGETATDYICIDYDVSNGITFYINKDTLEGKVDEDHKGFSFIVNEGWFASLNEEDVIKEENRRQIIVIKDDIKLQKGRLKKLLPLDININENYKVIDFNSLQKGDKLYLLDDCDQLQPANIVGFFTSDRIHYMPIINCKEFEIYNAEVKYNADKKEYFINVHDGYSGYVDYLVFKDKEDCELYLKNKTRKLAVCAINNTQRKIAELKYRLKKLEEK